MVECRSVKPEAGGSNPSATASFGPVAYLEKHGPDKAVMQVRFLPGPWFVGVAQSVERGPPKADVVGSNPITHSKQIRSIGLLKWFKSQEVCVERKLASIQEILDLQPIPGADTIEVATVLGWNVCVKKGEFQVGDRCIYVEVDSVLPESNPAFAFLATRKFRINTIRLRGQISQGICFPLSILEAATSQFSSNGLGTDVTELLGVHKYEPPLPAQLAGEARGKRPWFVPKTDEMRIQAVPGVLDRWKHQPMYLSEKIDGSSMSVYRHEGEFGVCSRNLDLLETSDNTLWKVARELDLETRLAALFPDENIVLQGEIAGEKIQGNKLKLKGHHFFLFSVWLPNQAQFAGFEQLHGIAEKLGLKTVPILDTAFQLDHSVDQLVTLATRKSVFNAQVWAEGIVFRPLIEHTDPELGRLSFKVINPEFLLKHGE